MMKITDVTLTLFAWENIPAIFYAKSSGRPAGGASDLGLLRILTDEGLEGHAFLGSSSWPASQDGPGLIRFLKPVLLGADPLERERLSPLLWQRSRQATIRAIGAVDVALWDLAGKIAGLPLHRLLGSCRASIPAYASSPVLPSASAYVEQAREIKEAGWAAYKIHPPQRPAEDIAVCEAVRQAVGESYTLMLDSVWTYHYAEAVKVGLAIEQLDFHWFEDPLADQDLYNYVKLKQKLRIPIIATEYPAHGLDAYVPWLMERATDALRGDVAVKGGITTLIKAAHLAEAFHLDYEVHHGGNSLNNLANLHVTLAIPNTSFFEVLLPDAAQKYGLAEDITVDRNGLVHAPIGSGLGAAIDFELIKAKTISVLS
jgi:L-alanine-DL-glutamate epimerase-like enolase superfamily enzyme